MHRRHVKMLVPLILLVYLLAQNGLVLAQLVVGISGHDFVTNWHDSHYDIVMSHAPEVALEVDSGSNCHHDCSSHHHFDVKPAEPVTPDAKSKSLLVLLFALLPTLLAWLLPLVRRQHLRWPLLHHRNSLSLLIRSTVLRH